jgi:hypothetical protein
MDLEAVLRIRDPVPFFPWIWDPGWIKSKDPDPESGMNNPDHISWSLEPFFGLKFFDADLGSGMEKFGSRIEKSRIQNPG